MAKICPNKRKRHKDNVRCDSFKDVDRPLDVSSTFQRMQTDRKLKSYKSMQESNLSCFCSVVKFLHISKKFRWNMYALGIIFLVFNFQLSCEAYDIDKANISQDKEFEEMTISWKQFMENDIKGDVYKFDENRLPWNNFFGTDLDEYDKKLERLRRRIAAEDYAEGSGSGSNDTTEASGMESTTSLANSTLEETTTNLDTTESSMTDTTGSGSTATATETTITVITAADTTQLSPTSMSETTGSGFTDTTDITVTTETILTTTGHETTSIPSETTTIIDTTETIPTDTTKSDNATTVSATSFTEITEVSSTTISETTGSGFTNATDITESTEKETTGTSLTETTGETEFTQTTGTVTTSPGTSEQTETVTTGITFTTESETSQATSGSTSSSSTVAEVTTNETTITGEIVSSSTTETTMPTTIGECQTDKDCMTRGQYCSNDTCFCNPGTYLINGACSRTKIFGGKLHLDVVFDVDLQNPSSEKFKNSSLNIACFLTKIYDAQDWFISVQVVSFISGSTVAQYNLVAEDSDVNATTVQTAFSKALSDQELFSPGCSCNSPDCNTTISNEEVPLITNASCEDAGTVPSVACEDNANSNYCNTTSASCSFSTDGTFSCACNDDYVPNPFEEESRFCVAAICMKDSDCNAPFGTCDTIRNYGLGQCRCMTGFAGTNCYSPWLFVFIIVMSFLAFLLILFIIFALVRRRRHKGFQINKKNYYEEVWEVNKNASTERERGEVSNIYTAEGWDENHGIITASYKQKDEAENGASNESISNDIPMYSMVNKAHNNEGFVNNDENNLKSASSPSFTYEGNDATAEYQRSKL